MYQSLEAEWHDLFWEAEGPAAELPLMEFFLKKHPGKALEIGCGSGRLLLPLLAKGYELEGLDNAPEMIDRCEKAARAAGLSPTLHCADLFTLPLDSGYQALALPAFTLQLLPDPIAAMLRMQELLTEGGGLYFSVFYPWLELEGELPEGEFYPDHSLPLPDGKEAAIVTRHELDRAAQILTRTHRYELRAGAGVERSYESRQVIRYATEEDWENLLHAAGFAVEERWEDFSQEENAGEESAGVTTYLARKAT
ncbi:class I SAM-dependent methyltransferase [Roseibacillus ishigakijimensis]|uniref:Class I SAM-dependent methyltransferase n=1 Tax=Roseibacillus ishigakijimensis TaxID=454146 RepID=A0A934RR68_9BACT|nr:class I SAM-dependent methyltransferase [Roseibacillus ishigakijimensis]MBK1834131.1 class I SAM-dependent methyltransferase [Roseibacillus ishigakijimensis]